MSATNLNVYTEVLTNPDWAAGQQMTPHRLLPNISYDQTLDRNLTILSSHDSTPGIPVAGLLYVPDLESDDPCNDITAPWVPKNVTRLANLPASGSIKMIAIAPWVTSNCTLNYLAAARERPIRGMIFFPANKERALVPPVGNPNWWLAEDTAWKDQNDFPVFGIPGAHGLSIMNASAQYSSNMTSVPHGHNLTNYFDSRDYVRLVANIDINSTNSLPSLWIFLLVVLGIMLVIIGLTSGTMHLLQRRRRNSLRRRVARGEVDLEALGIKRLTVPQDILDEMPLYTYGSGEPAELTPASKTTPQPDTIAEDKLDSPPSTRPSSPAPVALPSRTNRTTGTHRPTTLQQPTCAICLDDFVPASGGTQGTIVRELPCQHIFHPECVDTFLRDSSSLCPMCKKTALPTGYCPRVITNAMVRRERMVRRIRPRAESNIEEGNAPERPARRTTGTARFNRLSSWNDRRSSANNQAASTEMTPVPPPAAATRNAPILESDAEIEPTDSQQAVQPSSNPGRREWARQRAVAMLGRRDAPADPDAEEQRSMSRWRKALVGIFPAAAGGYRS